jgi:hypothetical protein
MSIARSSIEIANMEAVEGCTAALIAQKRNWTWRKGTGNQTMYSATVQMRLANATVQMRLA